MALFVDIVGFAVIGFLAVEAVRGLTLRRTGRRIGPDAWSGDGSGEGPGAGT